MDRWGKMRVGGAGFSYLSIGPIQNLLYPIGSIMRYVQSTLFT